MLNTQRFFLSRLAGILFLASLLLLAGCNESDSFDSTNFLETNTNIHLLETDTTIVVQSEKQMTHDEACTFCEQRGLRLPDTDELLVLADMASHDDSVKDTLWFQQYWADLAVDENNAFFGRPELNQIDISDKNASTYGALCMQGENQSASPQPDNSLGDIIGKGVDLGKKIADIPGVKVFAGPVLTFALREAGLDPYYEKMKEIEAKIDVVLEQLSKVQSQIEQSKEELKEILDKIQASVIKQAALTRDSINYPKEATRGIAEAFRKFREAIIDKEPAMLKAAHEEIIYGSHSMIYQYNAIYEAISLGSSPLLTNYTTYLGYSNLDFQESYSLLEKYFINLIEFEQLAFSLYLHFMDPDKPSRETEIDAFKECLADQAGRESMGNVASTYSHNIFRLVVHHLRPNNVDGYLNPVGSSAVLKKTEFLRRSLAGQNCNGLFGAFITTEDLYAGKYAQGFSITAKNTSTGVIYNTPSVSSVYNLEGPVYDHRSADTPEGKIINIEPSKAYKVHTFAFENLPEGKYEINIEPLSTNYSSGQFVYGSEPEGNLIGWGHVQRYNVDYEKDANGSLEYGYAFLTDRVHNRYTEKSTLLREAHWDYKGIKQFGDENNWPMGIEFSKKLLPWSTNRGSGKRELRADFVYTGKKDQKLNLDFAVSAFLRSGDTSKLATSISTIHLYAGIYDATDKKRISPSDSALNYHHEHTSQFAKTQTVTGEGVAITTKYYQPIEKDLMVNETFSFKPIPNHHYYLYIYVKMDNGFQDTNGTINSLDYLYFRFED